MRVSKSRFPMLARASVCSAVTIPLAALLLSLLSPAAAQQVPVTLSDTGEDACSVGQVAGLDTKGDGFLAVRTGPGSKYEQTNSVFNGDMVSICQTKGSWLGIVYGRDECVGGSPEGATQNGPYRGSCLSGWVFSRYVRGIAG